MKKHSKADNILLALALFTVSGVGLIYNLSTAAGEEIAVSLSALADKKEANGSVISDFAVVHFIHEDAVTVSAVPDEIPSDTLLPPIVAAPQK